MLLQDGKAHSAALHAIQWRHLLERAGTRLIFVRHNSVGASQHWGHAVLESVKNDSTLVVKPDSGHKKSEEVAIENTHLWMSKTVNNHMGGFDSTELHKILEEGEQMVLLQLAERNTEVKETDIVIMDLGSATYYAGQPVQKRYAFTEKATEAFHFKRIGDAQRSTSMLNRNPAVTKIISETGLVPMTMKQAWQVMKVARELRQNLGGQLPPLKKLSEVQERRLDAIPELYAAAFPETAPTGMPINQPVLSDEDKRKTSQKNKPTNGTLDGNGHSKNPIVDRLTGMFAEATAAKTLEINPALYNAATVPVAIQQADAEVETAMRDVLDAQAMVSEAVQRLQAARAKHALLLLQIHPQIMAQALKEQALASMKDMQTQLMETLLKIGSDESGSGIL